MHTHARWGMQEPIRTSSHYPHVWPPKKNSESPRLAFDSLFGSNRELSWTLGDGGGTWALAAVTLEVEDLLMK